MLLLQIYEPICAADRANSPVLAMARAMAPSAERLQASQQVLSLLDVLVWQFRQAQVQVPAVYIFIGLCEQRHRVRLISSRITYISLH